MGFWMAALALPGYFNGTPGFFNMVYLHETFGATYSEASWLILASAIGAVLWSHSIGHGIDRHGARVVAMFLVAVGPLFTLTWFFRLPRPGLAPPLRQDAPTRRPHERRLPRHRRLLRRHATLPSSASPRPSPQLRTHRRHGRPLVLRRPHRLYGRPRRRLDQRPHALSMERLAPPLRRPLLLLSRPHPPPSPPRLVRRPPAPKKRPRTA